MAAILPFPADPKGRRILPRLAIRIAVEYRSLEDFLVDYTSNISLGGMSLHTRDPLQVGTEVELRFTLPGSHRPLCTGAVVQWQDEVRGKMGLCFQGFGKEDLAVLEGLLGRSPAAPEPRLGRIVGALDLDPVDLGR